MKTFYYRTKNFKAAIIALLISPLLGMAAPEFSKLSKPNVI